ncbi:cation:proton antiporter [candidate division KSB1 bacterium]
MHIPVLLQDLFTLSVFAFLVIFIFQKLKLPITVGFLVVGSIVGPYGLGVITDPQQVIDLEEIGIILLLFVIGLEFSIRDLMKLKKAIFGAGILQIIITILATAVIAYYVAGESLEAGIFWGFMIALSSTAIVMRGLQKKGMLNSPSGRLSLAVLIMQDLAIAVMLGILPFLKGDIFEIRWMLILTVIKMALLIAALLLAGLYLLPKLFYVVVKTRSRELFLVTIMFIILAVLWISAKAGLTLALGAFIAGLILSESEFSHQAMAEIMPFRNIFAGLFFISVGMMLNINFVWSNINLVFGFLFIIIIGKFILTSLSLVLVKYPLPVALMTGIAISQIGEFSLILVQEGQKFGFLQGDRLQSFLAPAILSMMLTPFLIRCMPRFGRLAFHVPLLCRMIPSTADANDTQKISRLENHVIIAGYGLNGKNLARILKETAIPYIIIELNGETVRQEKARGESIFFGDVTYPDILKHLGADRARVLVLTLSDPAAVRRTIAIAKSLNPALNIITRTLYVTEVEDLYTLGATEVIPQEFETGIQIFNKVLQCYGIPINVIHKYISEIRREGYEKLRIPDLPPFHHHNPYLFLQFLQLITYQISGGKALVGKSLGELQFRTKTGVTIIAVARDDNIITNPGQELILKKDDIIAMVGADEALQKAIEFIEEGKLSE